jgi:tripartite ATP-independent transporter DctM subunit
MIYFRVLVNRELGPPVKRSSLREKLLSLKPLWAVIVIFIFVIGGLYLGVFTPTEAGALGASAMCIVTLVKRTLTWGKVKAAMVDTVHISCMIFFIIIGIQIFSSLVVATGVAGLLVNYAITLPPGILLLGLTVVYLIFGCFIGVLGMLVTTLPFVFPVVTAAGFDPIWFGIIVIKLCEIAMITPPVGINVFVTANATKMPIEKVFRSVIPFFFMDLLTIVVLTIFPQIITFLPAHVG